MSEESSFPRSLPATELVDRIERGEELTVLDVRDRDQFEAWHVDGPNVAAIQVPHQRFVAAGVTDDGPDLVEGFDEPIVVVCGEGAASAEVADQLRDAGVVAANLADGMEGWGRVYRAESIPHPDAEVVRYRRPATGCLAHLVVAGDGAAVIDPLRAFAGRYADDAADRGAELRWAIDTHVHADHVSGVRDVAASTSATPVLPGGARDRGLAWDDVDVRFVGDGETLAVGDVAIAAVHLPGHTSEATGFRLGDLLFGGDLLFPTSVARPDLEGAAGGHGDGASGVDQVGDGDAADPQELAGDLFDSLASLADGDRVAPGHYDLDADLELRSEHGDPLVIDVGDARARLALLDLDREEFLARVTDHDPAPPANVDRILAANLGREPLSDGDAFAVELGPNNCAARPAE